MNIKKCWPDVLAILAFVVISFVYFFPADTEGRILYQHDASAGKGAGVESEQYMAKTGERTRWTNSLFCGMPTYQSAPSYDSSDTFNAVERAYHLWLPNYVWYVFVSLLGFYILMRAFNFRQSLAALGSIIWAFSSYFFIIIAAGHIWKVWTLAYIPPTIAGLVLAYRGKYLWGALVMAVFVAFQIKANHVQMSYYFLAVMLLMWIAYLVDTIKNKTWKHFAKATAACIVGGILGVAVNASNLYHTYEYSKETMRGKSELKKADSANQTNSGLERDYITAWSYGVSETWTLLVPNVKGGASVPLSQSKVAMEKADPAYYQLYQQIGQYWGNQPGTSGPVYVGAFVLFLFILGLFIVKGPMKWALFAATLLSIFLAWGKNFMGFTDFFIDYIPMYAKFRTVASILVIAEFTIPVLAIMALKQWIDNGSTALRGDKRLKIGFWTALVLTAGASFIFAVAPGLFFSQFISDSEMQALQGGIPAEQLSPILQNLTDMRKAMVSADAWRSFIIIIIGVALLLLYKGKKMKATYMVCGIIVLCLVDMWQINKRYLNDDMFVSTMERDTPQQLTATDTQILQDKSLDYRVLNFASNTFNENETSYYHKSIGGYHAAKLRRYQELIEAHIGPEMQKTSSAVVESRGDLATINGDSIFPVLNMLNTKYFIFPLQDGQTTPIINPHANGCAWFVDKIQYVDNANEELDALSVIDLKHVAVADKAFKDVLGEAKTADSTATIDITAYEPNKLTYDVNSQNDGMIVFSEIYYPGWTATVDGKEVELGRVNYVLRAMPIEAGKHEIVLSFFPKSIDTTETIAYAALAILALGIVFLIVTAVVRAKRKQ